MPIFLISNAWKYYSATRVLLLLLSTVVFSSTSSAETVRLAVASNFAEPIRAIIKQFEQQTSHTVVFSLGSSGKLFAQIQHGAPFDVFLSADADKPERLIQSGDAVSPSKTYAMGQLVLWSSNSNKIVNGRLLKEGDFNKIALANPKLAPYGLAAQETLEALDLTKASRSTWIMGENINQAFQFVQSGNADLGFIAYSQLKALIHKQNQTQAQTTSSSFWLIPSKLHQPIKQNAVMLKRGQENPAAQAFFDYLFSPAVTELIVSHGYQNAAR